MNVLTNKYLITFLTAGVMLSAPARAEQGALAQGPAPAPVPGPAETSVEASPGGPPAVVGGPLEATPLPPPPPPPAVNAGPPLVVHGSYFTRYELRQHYNRLGIGTTAATSRFQEGDRAVYRFRTSLTTGPINVGGDKLVLLHFAPQASGFYPAFPASSTAGSSNPTVSESDLGVVEGYLRLESAGWAVNVGRFIMNYGSSAVIGNLDWHQSGRSFQGARWQVKLPEKAFLDIFLTQQAEGNTAVEKKLAGGDEYFAGIYSGLAPLVPALKALDVYALAKIWGPRSAAAAGSSVSSAVQATVGSLIKADVGALDFILEGGVQFGKRRVAVSNRSVLAYNVDAEAGFKLATGLRAAVYGAYVSGDDGEGSLNNWDELYPTTHMFFGLMDIIGPRSNIADAALRLSYAAPGNMLFKLDIHNFFRPQDASAALPGKQNGYAGSEGNLHVIHKLGKDLALRAMYGLFLPNEDIYATDDKAHYLEVELRYDI